MFTKKKLITIAKKCLDKNAPGYLQAIYFDGEVKKAVATDGHKLFMSSDLYSEKLKGLLLNPDTLEVLDREYPKWKTVLPKDEPKTIRALLVPKLTASDKAVEFGLIEQEASFKLVPKAYLPNGEALAFFKGAALMPFSEVGFDKVEYRSPDRGLLLNGAGLEAFIMPCKKD